METRIGQTGPIDKSQDWVQERACSGYSVKKFKADNPIPIFGSKVNLWQLIVSTEGEPTKKDIETDLYRTLSRWFYAEYDILFGTEGAKIGPIYKVKILKVSKEPIPVNKPTVARRENATPLPTLQPGRFAYVLVQFDYHGHNKTMPFPVWQKAWIPSWCPVDAHWMLSRVYETKETAKPPVDPPGPLDQAAAFLKTAAVVATIAVGIYAFSTVTTLTKRT